MITQSKVASANGSAYTLPRITIHWPAPGTVPPELRHVRVELGQHALRVADFLRAQVEADRVDARQQARLADVTAAAAADVEHLVARFQAELLEAHRQHAA